MAAVHARRTAQANAVGPPDQLGDQIEGHFNYQSIYSNLLQHVIRVRRKAGQRLAAAPELVHCVAFSVHKSHFKRRCNGTNDVPYGTYPK